MRNLFYRSRLKRASDWLTADPDRLVGLFAAIALFALFVYDLLT